MVGPIRAIGFDWKGNTGKIAKGLLQAEKNLRFGKKICKSKSSVPGTKIDRNQSRNDRTNQRSRKNFYFIIIQRQLAEVTALRQRFGYFSQSITIQAQHG